MLFFCKNNEYYTFDNDSQFNDSLYEVEFIENDIFYRYGFIINNEITIKEYLYKRYECLVCIFYKNKNKIKLVSVSKDISNLIVLQKIHYLYQIL